MAIALHSTPSGVNEPALPMAALTPEEALAGIARGIDVYVSMINVRHARKLNRGLQQACLASDDQACSRHGSRIDPADLRLTDIAAELDEIFCEAETRAASLTETPTEEAEFRALMQRFSPLEEELIATPAASLIGVLAKVQAVMIPGVRDCSNAADISLTITKDLARICRIGGNDA